MMLLELLLFCSALRQLSGLVPYVPSKPAGLMAVLGPEGGKLTLSPDGRRLVCCHEGRRITAWNLGTLKPIRTTGLKGERRLTHTWFRPDGKLLFVVLRESWDEADGRGEMAVKTYDFDSDREETLAYAHLDSGTKVAMSEDGRWLAAGGSFNSCVLMVWDLDKAKRVKFVQYEKPIETLSFNRASTLLAVGTRDAWVRVLDTKAWEVQNEKKFPWLLSGARFVSDSRLYIVWRGFNKVGLTYVNKFGHAYWDVGGAGGGRAAKPSIEEKEGGAAFAYSAKLGVTAAAYNDELLGGNLVLFDLATGKRVASRRAHNKSVEDVVISKDGRLLCTSGPDGVKVWSLPALLGKEAGKR